MGQFYEVQFAKRLDGADQHGNVTDSVKFTTEENSALWTHKPETQVTQGMKVYGRVEQRTSAKGNTYYKFVREQQEQGSYSGAQSSPATANGQKDDRADGMRQGMSINNATVLMAAFIQTGAYTNTDPAQVVADLSAFAKGIYQIDVTSETFPVTDEDLGKTSQGNLLDDIDGLFPGSQSVSNPGTDAR